MIAIVAQNHTLLTLFRMLLNEHGFQSTTFLENETTVANLVASCPTLIIVTYFSGFIDEELPLVQALHASPELAHVPMLFCASHEAWPDDFRKTANFAWLRLVDQPFRDNSLVEAIEAVLP